jgi:hypothetical protein
VYDDDVDGIFEIGFIKSADDPLDYRGSETWKVFLSTFFSAAIKRRLVFDINS